jgi:hypothetical protein
MAYIDCPSCGQRAPGKATRCPECGLIFTPGIRQHSIDRPGLRLLRRGLVIAGAAGVLAAAFVVFQGLDLSRAFTERPVRTGFSPQTIAEDTTPLVPAEAEQTVAAPPPVSQRQEPAPAPARDQAPPVETPPATVPAAAGRDSAPSVAPAVPLDTTPAIEPPPDSAPQVAIGDTTPPIEPAVDTASPAAGRLQRYARTWVSIRESRSDSAAAVRTLSPGEAVQVDSLSEGWYRVVVDGGTEGYIDGSYLEDRE